MKPTLSELIRPYRSISIIGMCKNAGKTCATCTACATCTSGAETFPSSNAQPYYGDVFI